MEQVLQVLSPQLSQSQLPKVHWHTVTLDRRNVDKRLGTVALSFLRHSVSDPPSTRRRNAGNVFASIGA